MNSANRIREVEKASALSVSYKAPNPLDLFLQNLPDVVIITDPHFVIKAFNHAAETFFDQPASHFIGTVLEQSVNFEFRSTTRSIVMEKLFKTGTWNGEIIFTRHNNQQFIFNANVSLLYDENGEVISIVLVNHNITDEEKQEKELALAETKYKIVVDTLSEGVILMNADGTIGAANKKAVEILGLSEEELKGRVIASPHWNAVKEDGTSFPAE